MPQKIPTFWNHSCTEFEVENHRRVAEQEEENIAWLPSLRASAPLWFGGSFSPQIQYR